MKTTIALAGHKNLTVLKGPCTKPTLVLELGYNNIVQAYGIGDLDAARKLVEALNTFIKEAQCDTSI
jgi:hypothetical protein